MIQPDRHHLLAWGRLDQARELAARNPDTQLLAGKQCRDGDSETREICGISGGFRLVAPPLAYRDRASRSKRETREFSGMAS